MGPFHRYLAYTLIYREPYPALRQIFMAVLLVHAAKTKVLHPFRSPSNV